MTRPRRETGPAPRPPDAAVSAPRRSGADVDPIGPDLSVAHRGWTVLCCSASGRIERSSPDGPGRDAIGPGAAEPGLWDVDTRIVSRHDLLIGGKRAVGRGVVSASNDRWDAVLLIPRGVRDPTGPRLPEDAISVHLSREVGRGMTERIVVVNRSMAPLKTSLDLDLDADFIDVMEIGRHPERGPRRATTVSWSDAGRILEFAHAARHQARHLERGLRVAWRGDAPAPRCGPVGVGSGRRLSVDLELAPGGRWAATLTYASLVGGHWRSPDDRPTGARHPGRLPPTSQSRLRLTAAGDLFAPAIAQAATDLDALRNEDLEREIAPSAGPAAWIVNAGVPRFTGFFGRDSLTAAYQAALLGPELMRGALAFAARHQGRRDDPWNEEQPGRMVHEMRRGPLSVLGIRPHGAYYGSHTTGAMFLVALSELWHWTGDTAVLERLAPAARDVIAWAERDGDPDGDGFLEYDSRSPDGLKNQGWKDSDEAIRDAAGRIVPNPIATVEEQAFHYVALTRMAEIHVVLGDDAAADACLDRAARLRRRFAAAYELRDEDFLALGLGPDKRPIATIASNAGHALAAGILDAPLARRVATRLLESDLFTAWGVRSLSAHHPSFNPFAYHLGAIWPVENASFALGCKRYGLDDEAERLTDAIFRAAGHHHRLRLPEAIAGIDAPESPLPIPYPRANRPQAWSASAVVQACQVMLGLYPYAGAGLLAVVRPRLPAWLPWVSIEGLRVGEATVAIDFERQADGSTAWQLGRADGSISVVGAPPPQDVDPGNAPVGERLASLVVDRAPGRTARAIRIGLGREHRLSDG